MPIFKVETSVGYCGTEVTYLVKAETEEEASSYGYAEAESLIESSAVVVEGDELEEFLEEYELLEV